MAQLPSKRALFVLSSVETSPITGEQAGWYLPEFVHPYAALEGAAEIIVASPKGGFAPLNLYSAEESKEDELCARYFGSRKDLWANTERLSSIVGRASEFDVILFVGGWGPMFDIATDPISQALIAEFWEKGKVVAAVCHGVAALMDVQLSDGTYVLEGKRVTGFSEAEEQSMDTMPFSLEQNLNHRSGGRYEKGLDFTSHIVVDGQLLTGQNPASVRAFGEAVRNAL